mgnify:FL=1
MRSLLLNLYSVCGLCLYPLARLAAPFVRRMRGRISVGYAHRLGIYDTEVAVRNHDCRTIWLHAASVGETQAALILLKALYAKLDAVQFVFSTSTEQGYQLAKKRVPPNCVCILAPLDVPQAVDRAIAFFSPSLYLCLETELWPLMLSKLRRHTVPILLLNGRISERSLKGYRRLKSLFSSAIQGLRQVAVITPGDGERFVELGIAREKITVAGNLKFDLPMENEEELAATRKRLRERLGVGNHERILLCGSTHGGEEEILCSVFSELSLNVPMVLVLAPRHLERLTAVQNLLHSRHLGHERYSQLQGQHRQTPVVLVDTMGDLAELYCAGDFLFCGGSLLPRLSGHNIMEAARWGRPVYFGPYMKDWRDAASLLTSAGGGFQVEDGPALVKIISCHVQSQEAYTRACHMARETAQKQRGAVLRQIALVEDTLYAQN